MAGTPGTDMMRVFGKEFVARQVDHATVSMVVQTYRDQPAETRARIVGQLSQAAIGAGEPITLGGKDVTRSTLAACADALATLEE